MDQLYFKMFFLGLYVFLGKKWVEIIAQPQNCGKSIPKVTLILFVLAVFDVIASLLDGGVLFFFFFTKTLSMVW